MSSDTVSAHKSRGGVARIFRAFGYSCRGLAAAFRHEAAFRQELALLIVLIGVAAWLARSAGEFAALVAALIPVLVVELVNSAIEALADAISVEHHELLGRAKDIGSAAVLLSMAFAVLVWFAILWPRLA